MTRDVHNNQVTNTRTRMKLRSHNRAPTSNDSPQVTQAQLTQPQLASPPPPPALPSRTEADSEQEQLEQGYAKPSGIMSATNRPWNVPSPIFSEEFVEQFFLTIETQFRTAKIEENQQKFDYLLPLIPCRCNRIFRHCM